MELMRVFELNEGRGAGSSNGKLSLISLSCHSASVPVLVLAAGVLEVGTADGDDDGMAVEIGFVSTPNSKSNLLSYTIHNTIQYN